MVKLTYNKGKRKRVEIVIKDATGITLTPGNLGKDCAGSHAGECCCDECDYLQCCLWPESIDACDVCTDTDCPRRKKIP